MRIPAYHIIGFMGIGGFILTIYSISARASGTPTDGEWYEILGTALLGILATWYYAKVAHLLEHGTSKGTPRAYLQAWCKHILLAFKTVLLWFVGVAIFFFLLSLLVRGCNTAGL